MKDCACSNKIFKRTGNSAYNDKCKICNKTFIDKVQDALDLELKKSTVSSAQFPVGGDYYDTYTGEEMRITSFKA